MTVRSMKLLLDVFNAKGDVPETLIIRDMEDSFSDYYASFKYHIELAVLMARSKSLKHLSLDRYCNTKIDLDIVVTTVLKHSSTLVSLKMVNCIDADGLADALMHNYSLRSLTLELGSRYSVYDDRDAIGVKFGLVLARRNSILENFALRDDAFSNKSGVVLAGALAQNSSLRRFMLYGRSYSDETGLALADALKQNNTLESFTLVGAGCSDRTGVALAETLRQNFTMKSFKLCGGYSDQTGVALADSLIQNSTIKSFWLDGALCADDTGVAFSTLLHHTSTLETLKLVTRYTDRAGVAMAESLERNGHIQRFCLCRFGDTYGGDANWDPEVEDNADCTGLTVIALAAAFKLNHALRQCVFDLNDFPLSEMDEVSIAEAVKGTRLLSLRLRDHSQRQVSAALSEALSYNRNVERDRVAFCAVAQLRYEMGFKDFSSIDFRQYVGSFLYPLSPESARSLREDASGRADEPESGPQGHGSAPIPAQSPAANADPEEGRGSKPGSEEAHSQENDEVSRAILQSKADLASTGMPLSSDGVVILCLTRHARSPEVIAVLLESLQCGELETCRVRVEQAGCEVMPEWADGATLLVPLTQEHMEDIDFALTHQHVVALPEDVPSVRAALRRVDFSKRPKLRSDHTAVEGGARRAREPQASSSPAAQPADGGDEDADDVVGVEVLYEFAPQTDSSVGFPHRISSEPMSSEPSTFAAAATLDFQ